MKLLIKNAVVADPRSASNGNKCDLLIVDGIIEKITSAGSIRDEDAVMFAENCMVSPGWIDMRVNFREPGEEQKETLQSGLDAAAAGGFTGVLLMPSVTPPVSNRGSVEFVKSNSGKHVTEIYPAGTITEKREGKELSEMYDMQQGGAVIFTDDKRYLQNSGLMLRAMQYAGNINARLISYAEDSTIAGSNIANESATTTLLGFKGSASVSEVIAIERDLNLVRYTGQPLHFAGISTREAVEAIKGAKMEGLPVTAEVFIHHLIFDDSALNEFDTTFKVRPPLRSRTDVEVLKEAVLDGTVDVVSSDHSPQDIEAKEVEFDFAGFGMSGTETLYPALNLAFGDKLSSERLIEILSINPRNILGLSESRIEEGTKAVLTVYNPSQRWTYSKGKAHTRGVNSPFEGKELIGKVIGVINGRFAVGN